MIGRFTLRNVGIAGAVVGVIALGAKPAWDWLSPTPIATIDSPAMHATVPRCFVARGTVVPGTILRPLWLIQVAAGGRWREVGRVDTAQETWASRVCPSGEPGTRYRLALVLADDALDAEFRRLVHPEELEAEIPEWLKMKHGEQQGGYGGRRSFPSLPAGATPLSVVDGKLFGHGFVDLFAEGGRIYRFPAVESEPPTNGRSQAARTRHGGYGRSRPRSNLRATLY